MKQRETIIASGVSSEPTSEPLSVSEASKVMFSQDSQKAKIAANRSAPVLSVPSAPIMYLVQAFDGTIYERRYSDMISEAETIKDVADGQFGNDIAAIYQACTEGPIFRNVTEDILRAAGCWNTEDETEIAPRSDFDEHNTLNHSQQGIR